MAGKNCSSRDLLRFNQIDLSKVLIGFMMINIDIRLAKAFEGLSHPLEVSRVHSDKGIAFSRWYLDNEIASFQMLKRRWDPISQNHLHGLSRIAQGQAQSQKGTYRIPIWSDM